MKLSNRKMVTFFMAAFIIVSVWFPADFYHLKQITFFLTIVFGSYQLAKQFANRRYLWVYMMGIVFPAMIILQSILRGSSFGAAFSGGYTATLFFLLILVMEYDIEYEKYLMFALRVVAYVTVLIVLLDVIGVIDANGDNFIRNFIYQHGIGLMGKSSAYSSYYKIFIKTSPLLILLLNYSIDKRDIFHVIICIVALLFGTRANLFIMLLLLLYKIITLVPKSKNERIIKIAMILSIIFGGGIAGQYIADILYRIMNTAGSVSSDAIRAGQVRGIIEVFERPFQVLFGAGFGNDILFDYGRNTWVSDFEISYFALFAKIGIIWFSVFMVFVLLPIFEIKRKSYIPMYIGYLMICFTNPLLYSSTAFLLYLYVYKIVIEDKEKRKYGINNNPNI